MIGRLVVGRLSMQRCGRTSFTSKSLQSVHISRREVGPFSEACSFLNGRKGLSTRANDEDAEKKTLERERMKKELGRMILGGTLYDVRAASKTQDSKVFPTEVVSSPFEMPESLRSLKTLTGKEVYVPASRRPTALLLAFNQLGWSMLDDWREFFLSTNANVLLISVVEGWSTRLFKSSIEASMKKSTPQNLHDNVVLWTAPFDKERAALEIENRAIGYAFLIDNNGMVQLKGCGKLVESDRPVLQRCLETMKST